MYWNPETSPKRFMIVRYVKPSLPYLEKVQQQAVNVHTISRKFLESPVSVCRLFLQHLFPGFLGFVRPECNTVFKPAYAHDVKVIVNRVVRHCPKPCTQTVNYNVLVCATLLALFWPSAIAPVALEIAWRCVILCTYNDNCAAVSAWWNY